MAARRLLRADLVESTLPEQNGEAESNGAERSRGEKPRSRNLVMPDSLYDALALYALQTKVKVKKGRDEYRRSLTVSEAACKAIDSYLRGIARSRTRGAADAEPTGDE
jgi:hypothetical protein